MPPVPRQPAENYPGTIRERALAHLDRRSRPHFNQLVVWCLLAAALTLACWPTFVVRTEPHHGHATLLFWLPNTVLASAATFWLFRGLLLAGTILWLANRWLPWSCWLTTLGFTGLWSLHVENTYNSAHIFHMTNMLLVLQSLWYTADAAAIRRALADHTNWQTPLVPRWVSLSAIAYIGIFHTAAGLSKLVESGPGWASGTSLQIWTYLWGYSWSPTTWLIVGSRTLTRWLQIATLVVETAGVLAIFPRLRPWIGLGLVGFYAGVLATFQYGFEFNALFTALYFFPVEAWIERRYGEAAAGRSTVDNGANGSRVS